MSINDLRRNYHQELCRSIIRIRLDKKQKTEYPNFADGTSKASSAIAWGIVLRLGYHNDYNVVTEQHAGALFQSITNTFLQQAFKLLAHLRPGEWVYSVHRTAISGFTQFEHLSYLKYIIEKDKRLLSAFGGDYVVAPDIVIGRLPVSDDEINRVGIIIAKQDVVSTLTPFRASNQAEMRPILHASISCKWTIRSDRSQNTRTEALNLMRNRKGHLPHIVALTAEPMPTRIASLALGTGDLDCVYHFALPEMQAAIQDIHNEDQLDMLNMLIEGRRLRDISDLPFDLAV
jgi:hypothetical protein